MLLLRIRPRISPRPNLTNILSKRLVSKPALTPRPKPTVTEQPVPQLQDIFRAPEVKSRHILAHIGALTQIVFWGNLAQWAGTGYVIRDKYRPPNRTWKANWGRETGQYELADVFTRCIYAGWLGGLGVVFAYGFLWVPSR
jgi:hypothetical protein